MNDPRNALSRRFVDGLSVLCATVLVVAGLGLIRTVTARADQPEAWSGSFGARVANTDSFRRCSADVIVVLDLASAGKGSAETAATSESLKNLFALVTTQGARWALVGYGSRAEVLGAPATKAFTGADPAQPLLASKAAAKAVESFEQQAQTSQADARNWEAGLLLAGELASQTPADRPLVVVHIASAGPSRRLLDGAPTTSSEDPADIVAAATAADGVRSRPNTHLYGVAIDTAEPALAKEWAAVAGPEAVVHGSRPLVGATDDVISVTSWALLPEAIAALSQSLCTTNVEFTVLAAADGSQPAGDAAISLSPRADATGVTLVRSEAQQRSDAAGHLRWSFAAPNASPFSIEVADDNAAPSERRSALCSDFRGVLPTVGGQGGKLVIQGLLPGTDVRCELRLTDATPAPSSLTLRHTAATNEPAECTGDSARSLIGVAVGTIGQVVDHCLAVTNNGSTALQGVHVEASGLGLTGPTVWVLEAPLAPGQTVVRHISRTLMSAEDIEAVATVAPATATPRASAIASHQVLPPELEVERSLSSADRAECGDSTPQIATGQDTSYCYTVSNRGGTMLDNISINDPAIGAEALKAPKVLGPGQSATVVGSAILQSGSSGVAVATARATDGQGDALPGVGPVSSNVDPNLSGLQAEQKLSALSVPEGGEVTASVTVTNTATKPLRGVSVNSSLCGDQTTANATLGDDCDSELEKGETWVYLCTQGISQETFAMATVTAQDSGTTATTRQVVRVERANLRMKKKQTNDLRIGKETTYILEVDNNGNIAAPDTVVSDPLDPAVTFVRATTNAGSCSLVEATVKCSLDSSFCSRAVHTSWSKNNRPTSSFIIRSRFLAKTEASNGASLTPMSRNQRYMKL